MRRTVSMPRVFPALALLWFVLVPVQAREPAPAPADKDGLRAYVLKKQGRQAYGVYVTNKKVGWLVSETRVEKHEGKEVAVESEEFYFVASFGGEKSVMTAKSLTRFELEGEGKMLS